MRELHSNELTHVSGASSCYPSSPRHRARGPKGNNGFGNGADANRAAPGNSGKTGGGKEGSFGDDRGER